MFTNVYRGCWCRGWGSNPRRTNHQVLSLTPLADYESCDRMAPFSATVIRHFKRGEWSIAFYGYPSIPSKCLTFLVTTFSPRVFAMPAIIASNGSTREPFRTSSSYIAPPAQAPVTPAATATTTTPPSPLYTRTHDKKGAGGGVRTHGGLTIRS